MKLPNDNEFLKTLLNYLHLMTESSCTLCVVLNRKPAFLKTIQKILTDPARNLTQLQSFTIGIIFNITRELRTQKPPLDPSDQLKVIIPITIGCLQKILNV